MTPTYERLNQLLSEKLNYHNPGLLQEQLAEAEAWQSWLIIESAGENKTTANKYLRAIEKRLSLGQTFLRRADLELRANISA